MRTIGDEGKKVTRILFVCWGNICRSPMAEFVMKDLAGKAGLEDRFVIASAATSGDEVWGGHGSPVYPPAMEQLLAHGIGTPGNELGVAAKEAVRLVRDDYKRYDMLIGMEQMNLRYMKKICGGDPEAKMSRLLDHTESPADIEDPWFTHNFRRVYEQIETGCRGLLEELTGRI